jgi:hypothetical protein
VLKSIERGDPPDLMKRRLQLSRYSYEYTLNRLLSNNLIKTDSKGTYYTTKKGKNVLGYKNGDESVEKKPMLLKLLGLDPNSL